MKKEKLGLVYEEIQHLLDKSTMEDFSNNLKHIPSVTNENFRYKNLIIRLPRKEFNIFFDRRNEYYNINLSHKNLDLCDLPIHFNQETGLMVTTAYSPEIFLSTKELISEYITQSISNLNNLNGHGLETQSAFNYEIAFAYFRSTELFNDEYLNWVESFYKKFFLTEDNARLEFSHNDPDITNFTITNQLIDYEYSGMSPVMSDICNFYAMYQDNQQVNRYFINTNAPKRDMEPLVIFWSLFWGMWGISKDEESIPNLEYTKKSAKLLDKGIKRLKRYRESSQL